MTLFHLARVDEWEARPGDGYAPEGFDEIGFVHCSTEDQVTETARTWFSADDDLVLVEIDPDGLDVRWVESHGDGRLFPHVHERIPETSVRSITPWGPGTG